MVCGTLRLGLVFAALIIAVCRLAFLSGPNSTLGERTNDREGAVLFMIGEREFCPRTSARMVWNEGVLDFHVFGGGSVVVRRDLDGEQLVREYVDGSATRMDRVCTLPPAQRTPAPRGRRLRLF